MLGLTKKAGYALIAFSHLARESDGLTSVRTIATRYGLPLPVLTNIMKSLVRAGLAVSGRGARGGYGLARPADEIKLSELLSAIEGPFRLAQCAADPSVPKPQRCNLERSCPIRSPVRQLHDRLMKLLDNFSLAQLVEDQRQFPQTRSVDRDASAANGRPPGETIG